LKKAHRFVKRLLMAAECDGIILFGSFCKGQEGWDSDVDILVISNSFGSEWFERHERIYRYSDGGMDIFLYTKEEASEMFSHRHLLLLEALADGLILHDEGYLKQLKEELKDLIGKGKLERLRNGWRICD
jgi:predicted nucleotidyltransferase